MNTETAFFMGLAYAFGVKYSQCSGLAQDRKPKTITEVIDGVPVVGYWKTLRMGSRRVFFDAKKKGTIVRGFNSSPSNPKTLKQAVVEFKEEIKLNGKKQNQKKITLTKEEKKIHNRFKKEFSITARSALRHYSADTPFGLNSQINKKERAGAPLSKVARRVDKGLQQAFKEANTIEDNDFVLYRGVAFDVASSLIGDNPSPYEDKGYSSTSTSLESAIQYADSEGDGTKYILVITPKKGTKAISLSSLSRTASDNEILLDKGIKLERYNVEQKGDTFFIFLR